MCMCYFKICGIYRVHLELGSGITGHSLISSLYFLYDKTVNKCCFVRRSKEARI